LLRIRLSRQGRLNHAHFRIVAVDRHLKQKGRFLEVLGAYDPHSEKTPVTIDQERLKHFLSVGAQVSDHLAVILKHAGVSTANPVASKRKPHKRKGKPAAKK
jgi:small subunit ribosomal protein S16